MSQSTTQITYKLWGEYAGQPVYLFRMENAGGAYVELTNYGATLVSAVVADAGGRLGNVVLGFQSLQAYLDDECYVGSTIGRYANRIGGAKFKLDDTIWFLENNDGKNTNHGGKNGFNSKVFKYLISGDRLFFSIRSEDGEGGYPGNLEFTVHYRWTDMNELIISYRASTDKRTVANFTNHAYFNLSDSEAKIFDHRLTVHADNKLETDAEYIPTGNIKPLGDNRLIDTSVKNTMRVGDHRVIGLNDCYLLNKQNQTLHEPAAELVEKKSGRKLEIFTTYPAIIVYTADFLQSKHPGHHAHPYSAFDGLCLECQYYPDSPNHPNFPATVLEAGDIYHQTIIYKFSTMAKAVK
ncbi:aldose epimerase family protein [Mucilaginibacter pocheonensis]|uniref:Aldose 1-epimerase n=1 Tax=Mucilaginibacter pocheonensis TaxID=398050 RepID=A0ABU1THY2_9SPHI|nr:aldose epimerase family protein [Mucilaginibacter pocheonensis]MDR6944854.1 aldose 1-epimerase [Mucilaginibacter pocheonensis]